MAKREGWVYPDKAGRDALMRSPMLADALRDVAEKIKAGAVAASPVGEGRQGHYRDQFFVEKDVHRKMKRVMYRVGNNADYAMQIEYGTRDTPAFRPLRRGAAPL